MRKMKINVIVNILTYSNSNIIVIVSPITFAFMYFDLLFIMNSGSLMQMYAAGAGLMLIFF